MRAWVQDAYGDLPYLSEVPEPTPREGEVVVAVRAASVNNGDTRVMMGEPLLVRPFFGWRRPKQRTRGVDVSGVVVSGGGFAVGTRVACEVSGGGFAERVAVPASRIAVVPDAVSDVAAASVVVAGGTAWAALEAAHVGAGSRVLVLGGSGGVGSFAVKLALLRGADVTVVCRGAAMELVRSWGASEVRARDDGSAVLRDGEVFDAVIDVAGDRPLRALRSLLAPGGVVAMVTGNGSRLLGPVGRIVRSLFVSRRNARLVPVAQKPSAEVLGQLLALVADGSLVPAVTREWSFDEVPDALGAVLRGEVMGKSIVRVA